MPGQVVTSGTFVFTDANGGHSCNLGTAPNVGEWDILCVNSNTTVSTPSGFTAEESAVTNQGAYLFSREATGGEASTVTITTSGNHNTFVGWVRLRNIGATDTTTSTQTNGGAGNSTPAHSTGTLAESGETSIAFAALHSIGGLADQNTPVWSSGYTGLLNDVQGSGVTGVRGFVAYNLNAGTAAETPSVSWSGSGVQNAYMLVITLTATGTDVALTATAVLGGLTATATITRDVALTATAALGELTAAATITVGPTITTVGPSGWQSLLDIVREARESAVPYLACPNDGEPLRAAPDGGQYCPFDGWRPQ